MKTLFALSSLLALAGCVLSGGEECPDILPTSANVTVPDSITRTRAPRGPALMCAPRPRDGDSLAAPSR